MRLDEAWWLVIIAAILTTTAYAAAAVLGYSSHTLILFGFLSGIIYALTTANDRRAVGGRPSLGEPAAFGQPEFIATAGLFGVLTTWVLLPVVYFPFSSLLNYPPQLTGDIVQSLSVGLTIGPVAIPWFLLTGIFTILSTLAYLYVLENNTVELLAVVGLLIYVLDILAGIFLYSDAVQSYERWAIFPLLLVVLLILGLTRPRGGKDSTGAYLLAPGRGLLSLVSRYGSLLIYVAVSFLLDLSIRESLSQFTGARQFFVSLCFRAVYFSILLLFGLFWWFNKFRSASPRVALGNLVQDKRKITLAIVTPLTFSLAFVLKMPVVANNLAVGPLLFFAGQTLALGFVGILYKTDGTRARLLARFQEVYLPSEHPGVRRYLYLVFYLVLLLVVIVWLLLRLVV